mgnify:CR=1 FL=1
MNWITTNLRLPEDLYMELKLKAARERKSVAAIIRDKLSGKQVHKEEGQKRKREKLLKDMDKFGRAMARKHPGLNLSKALIEMRYEQ